MKDRDCVDLLRWSLPRMGLRWQGFNKVRGQVCKRLARRLKDLSLQDVFQYRSLLEADPGEWLRLDSMCRITISRFYRDRAVFDSLCEKALASVAGYILAEGKSAVRFLSIGCGSGEEPYSIRLVWEYCVPEDIRRRAAIEITAMDADPGLIERAKEGRYPESSLRDLPGRFIENAFVRSGGSYEISEGFKRDIAFVVGDVRDGLPEGQFDVVFCRNLVLTYFDDALRLKTMEDVLDAIAPGGLLVIGGHEALPEGLEGLVPSEGLRCIYAKS